MNTKQEWLRGGRKLAWIILGLVLVSVGVGLFFRFYSLSYPNKQVFDEVYFPVFANRYLTGLDVFDVHPPLGKFIIAVGIWLFGNVGIGWRIMPAIFGTILPFLLGALAWKLFKSRITTLLVIAFAFLDGLFLAYSRTGLMDGILVSFIILFPLVCLWVQGKGWWWLISGISLGLAISIKWPALAVVFLLPWLIKTRGQSFRVTYRQILGMGLVAGALYLVIVGYSEYLDGARGIQGIWQATMEWNWQAYNYHSTIKATHPWSSAWWGWPLQLRPVLFLYDVQPDKSIQWMSTLGNPILWWSATTAVIWSVIYLIVGWVKRLILGKRWGWLVQGSSLWQLAGAEAKLSHPLVMLLVGYFAFWLPWGVIPRVVFQYHYFPSYAFALIILAYWLGRLWRRVPWLVLILLLAITAAGIYFIPGAVGWWGISYESLKQHIWVNSWLW